MYSPEQPRDENGRWASTGGATSSFVKDHGAEVAIGLGIAGAALATYGVLSVGTGGLALGAASKGVARASTVRKVGPIATSTLAAKSTTLKKIIPDTIEGWQYHAGAFSHLADDVVTPVGRTFKDLKVGVELIKKGKSSIVGAPKPIGYEDLVFKNNPTATSIGTKAVIGAGGLGAAATLLNLNHKKK